MSSKSKSSKNQELESDEDPKEGGPGSNNEAESEMKSGSENGTKSGSENGTRSGSENGTKSGSFLDASCNMSATMTGSEDSDYIDPGAYAQINISHDDVFVPSSPLGNPAADQGLDNARNKNQFLENFYIKNNQKLIEYETMQAFLMDLLIENLPDLMHGIDSPRMIAEGVKYIVDNLKQRFETYKLTIFEEDERELSNEEMMGKIKHEKARVMSNLKWYEEKMIHVNEENFNLKQQNQNLKAHIHALEASENEDDPICQYSVEKLRRFLRMFKRENSGLNEVLNQANDQSEQLWLDNSKLRKALAACNEDKQILIVQLAQVLDVKKMFQEAVTSVLQTSEDSATEASKESCRDIVHEWIRAMQAAFEETAEQMHEAVTKIEKIREDTAQKESEVMDIKVKFEEINNQINLLNSALYIKKVIKNDLEITIASMSREIELDKKYSEDLQKIYEKYKKLREDYDEQLKDLGSVRNSFDERPASSSPRSPGPSSPDRSVPNPLTYHPKAQPSSRPQPLRGLTKDPSPVIKYQYVDYDAPQIPSERSAAKLEEASRFDSNQVGITTRLIDYNTPSPFYLTDGRNDFNVTSLGQTDKPESNISRFTPSPHTSTPKFQNDDYGLRSPSKQVHASEFEGIKTQDPYTSPVRNRLESELARLTEFDGSRTHGSFESPIIKPRYIDHSTTSPYSQSNASGYVGSGNHESFDSPVIKPRYIDYSTPTPSSVSGASGTGSPNSVAKTIFLTSPGRKDPLKVDVEIDPKPLIKTISGEHFVCDISVNMQDAGKHVKREVTTPFRRRNMIRTDRESPPPLTVSKSRRPRGLFSPKSVFKSRMVAKRDLFGEGYQSPESPLGSGRWHDRDEYDLSGFNFKLWEGTGHRFDYSLPWDTSDGHEPSVIRPRYIPSPQSGSTSPGFSPRTTHALNWSPTSLGSDSSTFVYQSDRLSEPVKKTKFISSSGRTMRFPQTGTPSSLP